mmetsp:Transcript_9097/g.22269  ORF Transcript_9097/g.22269 Transcript_9097/m.22269 type:complete len:250 (+) Transcript_9097:1098-1847(+)
MSILVVLGSTVASSGSLGPCTLRVGTDLQQLSWCPGFCVWGAASSCSSTYFSHYKSYASNLKPFFFDRLPKPKVSKNKISECILWVPDLIGEKPCLPSDRLSDHRSPAIANEGIYNQSPPPPVEVMSANSADRASTRVSLSFTPASVDCSPATAVAVAAAEVASSATLVSASSSFASGSCAFSSDSGIGGGSTSPPVRAPAPGDSAPPSGRDDPRSPCPPSGCAGSETFCSGPSETASCSGPSSPSGPA